MYLVSIGLHVHKASFGQLYKAKGHTSYHIVCPGVKTCRSPNKRVWHRGLTMLDFSGHDMLCIHYRKVISTTKSQWTYTSLAMSIQRYSIHKYEIVWLNSQSSFKDVFLYVNVPGHVLGNGRYAYVYNRVSYNNFSTTGVNIQITNPSL